MSRIQELFNELFDDTEVPKVFQRAGLYVLVSSILARRVGIEFGSNVIYPNLYVMLISPPAKATKSTLISRIEKLYRKRFDDEELLPNEMTIQSLTNELSGIRRKKLEASGMIDGEEQIITNATLFTEEFGTFYRADRPEFSDILNTLWDCREEYTKKIITRGLEKLTNIYFSWFSGTTNEWIQTYMNQENLLTGLGSRMDFVIVMNKEKLVAIPQVDREKLLKVELEVGRELAKIESLQGIAKIPESLRKRLEEQYEMMNTGTMMTENPRAYVKLLKYGLLNAVICRGERNLTEEDIFGEEGSLGWVNMLMENNKRVMQYARLSSDGKKLLKNVMRYNQFLSNTLYEKKLKNKDYIPEIIGGEECLSIPFSEILPDRDRERDVTGVDCVAYLRQKLQLYGVLADKELAEVINAVRTQKRFMIDSHKDKRKVYCFPFSDEITLL